MSITWLGIAATGILVLSGLFGFRRGFVREAVTMFFWVLSIVLVWFMNPYVNNFLKENTPLYEIVQNSTRDYVESKLEGNTAMEEQGQSSLLESLGLPTFLTEEIKENNNAAVYQYLAVNTFVDYVSDYLALAAINGVSFLVSLLLATLLIRMLTYALDIIARLPVINGINKSAGALVGIVKGVLFIWIILLVMTIFCNTEVGCRGLELVERDVLLKWLYERNVFVNIFMNIL